MKGYDGINNFLRVCLKLKNEDKKEKTNNCKKINTEKTMLMKANLIT